MIKILSINSMATEILAHPEGKFSPEASYTLAEWLDENCPQDQIFNLEDIYCEWEEFPSAIEAAESYDWQFDGNEEDKTESAFFWLDHQTTIISVEKVDIVEGRLTIDETTGGGVIVRTFYI
jgi:hypothetical protein